MLRTTKLVVLRTTKLVLRTSKLVLRTSKLVLRTSKLTDYPILFSTLYRLVGLVVQKAPLSAREVGVRFPGRSNRTVSPTTLHRCDVSVLPSRKAPETGPATRYTLRRNATIVQCNEDLILIFLFLKVAHGTHAARLVQCWEC